MALQNICLAKIATSIHRHFHVYSTTDDEEVLRRYLFLQRIYTYQLISCLQDKELLHEAYTDLIFSDYLKTIDTMWFAKNFSRRTIIEIFAKVGPRLENVTFDVDFQHEEFRDIISHLPNVKSIMFEEFCYDSFLQSIAMYCPRLEKLKVSSIYDVSNKGLTYFRQEENRGAPCPLLKEIYVTDASVDENGIQYLLKNVPSLERIEYPELAILLFEIYERNYLPFDKIEKYNLTHLDLTDCSYLAEFPIYDAVLEACGKLCPNLKTLHYTVFKTEHLNLCSTLPKIEDLFINGLSIEVNDLLKEKSGHLICLGLRCCTVSFSVLGLFPHSLRKLMMDSVTIQNTENATAPVFRKLKILTIKEVDLSVSAYCKVIIHFLTTSPLLEKLYFCNLSHLPLEMKSKILQCCQQAPLQRLGFADFSVDIEFLKCILLSCSTLHSLNLYECNVTDSEMQDLVRVAKTRLNRPEITSYFLRDDYDEN